MFQKYFFICNYLLIILVGIIYYNKLEQSLPLKMFLWFLLYSLVTEVTGTYFAFHAKINTAVVYNTWNIINYLFYSYFFLAIIKTRVKRKVIFGLAFIFIMYELVNTLFYQNYLTDVYANSIILKKLFLVVIVLMYFSELLNSDRIISFQKSMFFWISLSVFIYALGFIPVFIIGEYISYRGIFRYITFGLNIIMSGCFITGFIVSKKEFNS